MDSKPIEFQPNVSVLLIGNPGVGKSTILNSFLGKPAFKSGISLGSGMTKILQEEYDENGVRFIDTPGLSDIDMREKAAKEIKAALTKGGLYKIFFVITLEAGRIRPDDKTTMKLVLEAAKTIQHSYSVIVNKVQEEVIEAVNDEDEKKAFLAKLNQGLPGTDKIFFNRFDLKIDAKKDAQVEISPGFAKFILEVAPVLEIKKETVNDIEFNDFDKIRKVLAEKLEVLERDRKILQQMVAKQSEEIIKMRESQEQAQKAHAEQIRLLQQSYSQSLQSLQNSIQNSSGKRKKLCGIF